MNSDKDRLEKKGLSWEEFKERVEGIFDQIEQLIKDTNGTKAD